MLSGMAQSVDGRYEAYCVHQMTRGQRLKWRILERRQTGITGSLAANPLARGPEEFDPATLNPLFVRPTILFPPTDEGLFATHAIAKALVEGVLAIAGVNGSIPNSNVFGSLIANVANAAKTVHDGMNLGPIRYSESRPVEFDGSPRVAVPAVVVSPFGSSGDQEELQFPGPSITVAQIRNHPQFHDKVRVPLTQAFNS